MVVWVALCQCAYLAACLPLSFFVPPTHRRCSPDCSSVSFCRFDQLSVSLSVCRYASILAPPLPLPLIPRPPSKYTDPNLLSRAVRVALAPRPSARRAGSRATTSAKLVDRMMDTIGGSPFNTTDRWSPGESGRRFRPPLTTTNLVLNGWIIATVSQRRVQLRDKTQRPRRT